MPHTAHPARPRPTPFLSSKICSTVALCFARTIIGRGACNHRLLIHLQSSSGCGHGIVSQVATSCHQEQTALCIVPRCEPCKHCLLLLLTSSFPSIPSDALSFLPTEDTTTTHLNLCMGPVLKEVRCRIRVRQWICQQQRDGVMEVGDHRWPTSAR